MAFYDKLLGKGRKRSHRTGNIGQDKQLREIDTSGAGGGGASKTTTPPHLRKNPYNQTPKTGS